MRKSSPVTLLLLLLLSATPAFTAITISNVTDKGVTNAPVSFTVTADPNAAVTTATLDGVAIAVGSAINVTIGYHELRAESRAAGGALVDSRTVRFIARDPARGDTETGIPPHTPARSVNDAPSAFAGAFLKVVAPAAWPVGLPIPVAARLLEPSGEARWLNGPVAFGGLRGTILQLRRGWGSVVAPAATAAGALELKARVHGLTHNPTISIEAAPPFTTVNGTVGSNTQWPPNSRIHVTGTLTVPAGVTLTIGAGTIVKLAPSTEIVVSGTLQVNGADGNPVVFTPDAAGAFWGGIELPSATSIVNASHTIFTGSGEDLSWFGTHGGYTSHKAEQALFLVAGSGAGTNVGAQLHLTDCFCFSLRGQQMNSRSRTWVDLSRTLMQRCITGGQLNDSRVTIDRCALIEFPGETGNFVDADNDGIYLTAGDLSLTNTVIGFCKDDGVDSGANGGDNPFTAEVDVTPYLSQNNWFEGTYHEGNSLSGTRNVSYLGCVFLNCGQGIEAGYSASANGNGPNATVDGCLFVNNMVGVRWGDNYSSGFVYNATMEVKNSLVLNSGYRDAFSGQWHASQANGWIYQTTATNTFGRAYFNVHNNYLSQPDPEHHPLNTPWNPLNPAQAALLASFMPVPGSAVGVGISTYADPQQTTAAYPGTFTVRLSTFSSAVVKVDWSVTGKEEAFADDATLLASGTLIFPPGETIKTIAAPVATPGDFGLLHVALSNPVNAEVTGEAVFITPTEPTTEPLITTASTGWRYRETRSEPPATWKQLSFDDSSAAATEWSACTLPAGFGVAGVTYGTTINGGPAADRTKAVYFRKKIMVTDPAQFAGVALRLRRDDAAIVWVNDETTPSVVSAEAALPGPYTYAMTGVANSTNTGVYLNYTIPASKFVAGQNIIAIEVHQNATDSSDLLLDVEFTAALTIPLALKFTPLNRKLVLWWYGPGDLLEHSYDLVNWFPAPITSGPVSVTPNVVREFFRLRR